jgi:hypothetical protein
MWRLLFGSVFLATTASAVVPAAHSPATEGPRDHAFRAAIASQAQLGALRSACALPELVTGFELDPWKRKLLDETGTVAAARAAVVAMEACSDGAARLAWRGYLGNEFLLAHPAALAEALALEKVSDERLREIVETEPDALFAIDCRALGCQDERREAFAAKRRALLDAPVAGPAKAARDRLVDGLVSDRSAR